jgi:CBS domain-containing protein
MSVGEICNREVIIINKGQTIAEAADLMREYHVGSLVVVEEGETGRVPVGILTDRDIVVEIIAKNVAYEKLIVGDVMTFDPATVRESDGISETLKLMRSRGVRRIPVVDDKGALTGIITTDDFLDLLAEELSDIVTLISHEQELEKTTRI